jgi:hypothetical protein
VGCLSSTYFAFLINGSPSGFFHASRGLRQWFPLSPLLFVLVVEGLNTMIKDARRRGIVEGIQIYDFVIISQLLFVDVTMIFWIRTLTGDQNYKGDIGYLLQDYRY